MDSCLSLTLQKPKASASPQEQIPHRAKPCGPAPVCTLRLKRLCSTPASFFFSTPLSKPLLLKPREKKRTPKTPVTSRQTNLSHRLKPLQLRTPKLQQAASDKTVHNWRTFTLHECEKPSTIGQDKDNKKDNKIAPSLRSFRRRFPKNSQFKRPERNAMHQPINRQQSIRASPVFGSCLQNVIWNGRPKKRCAPFAANRSRSDSSHNANSSRSEINPGKARRRLQSACCYCCSFRYCFCRLCFKSYRIKKDVDTVCVSCRLQD